MAQSHIIRALLVLILTASVNPFLCVAFSIESICRASSPFGSRQPPSSLQYYVHALNSGASSVLQPLNNKTFGTFGQAAVFGYRIHEGSDISSKTIGTIRGFEVYDSMNANETTILLLNTIVYDDGVYDGTLSLHGQADIKDTDYELTVVGGTVDFRGVVGYAAIHNLKTPGDDHIFEHTLHLLTPQSDYCSPITVTLALFLFLFLCLSLSLVCWHSGLCCTPPSKKSMIQTLSVVGRRPRP